MSNDGWYPISGYSCRTLVKNGNPRFVFYFQLCHNRLHKRVVNCLWLAVGEEVA